MINEVLIKKAEELAQSLTQEEIIEYEETWEDMLYFAHQIYDPEKIDRCFKMVTIYNLALSMKELNWSDEWKNRDVSNYPLPPDYAN
ncbi:MAG: hypothetical protein US85_C0016G0015 [Candidatus Shapirobacteria bacterium GW2011_GWF1_38_23]|nr:MAG: hypothetical protein US85_C0016G0015 [Candidatus Shapirobacteria bacterium GW2011_GWF1_38_23]